MLCMNQLTLNIYELFMNHSTMSMLELFGGSRVPFLPLNPFSLFSFLFLMPHPHFLHTHQRWHRPPSLDPPSLLPLSISFGIWHKCATIIDLL